MERWAIKKWERVRGKRDKERDDAVTGSGCWNAKQKRLNEHVVLSLAWNEQQPETDTEKIYGACFHFESPTFFSRARILFTQNILTLAHSFART